MKKTILTLLISILTISAYSQNLLNHLQNIGGTATVFFPDSPRINKVDNGLVYEANYNNILYTASTANVKLGPLDIFYKNFKESFYRGVLIGFAKSIHGKILYKKDIVVDGVNGIEYEGKGTFDTTNYYITYRSFYIDKKLVSQGMWFKEPVSQNDPRLNAFCSTFKFIEKPKNRSSWSDKALVIKGVKYAFIIILIITLIVGSIIFIVKRSSIKSQKNE
ncbi:MAG: hypothetical protein JO080_16750 [Mucilaginibacter sp.]|nr:hypothetical protein [Mucilaginibacter sp.]